MPEATEDAVKPKSREEEEKERTEDRLNGEIRESFDSMIKSLTDALAAKAKQVPHPNPIARFLGK